MKKLKPVTQQHKKKRSLKRTFISYVTPFYSLKLIVNTLLKIKLLYFYIFPHWVTKNLEDNQIIHVQLKDVKFFFSDWVTLNNQEFHISDHYILTGKWDECIHKIQATYAYNEILELIKNNWNHKKTKAYEQYLKALKNKNIRIRQHIFLDSIEKIDTYFLRFKALHDSIRQYGFLSNQTLYDIKGIPKDREIGIAINQDGTFIKLPGGQHRLAVALALQLETIPVEVRLIHCEYLKTNQLFSVKKIIYHLEGLKKDG